MQIFEITFALVLIFLFSQTVLPPLIGKRAFWLFRPSSYAVNPDELEIRRLQKEKDDLKQKRKMNKLMGENKKLNQEIKKQEADLQEQIDDLEKKVKKGKKKDDKSE